MYHMGFLICVRVLRNKLKSTPEQRKVAIWRVSKQTQYLQTAFDFEHVFFPQMYINAANTHSRSIFGQKLAIRRQRHTLHNTYKYMCLLSGASTCRALRDAIE